MTWPLVPLKDLGTWYGGGTPSKSQTDFWADGEVPWLSPKDMGPEVLTSTQDRITEAAVAGSSVRLVPARSVAVVVRSGILERTLPVAVVPFVTTLNQDMKALVPRDGVDPSWVAWGLRAFERDLLRQTRKAGTTVASIEMPRFSEFRLPLPDVGEQRRIVEILEDHLSRLDAAQMSIDHSLVRLNSLRESALAEALVSANADSPSSTFALAELARVGTGVTPLKGNKAFYDGGTIPWITSGDLHQGVITKATQFVTQRALEETSLKMVPAGALLVAMYGEGKTRGTAAELAIDATTNQACASIILNKPALRPWVRLVLDVNYAALRRLAAGGVQPNLNLSLVRAVEIPVPPESTRSALLGRIAEIDGARVQLRASLSVAQRRSASLRRSLLSAAFNGRLSEASRGSEDGEMVMT